MLSAKNISSILNICSTLLLEKDASLSPTEKENYIPQILTNDVTPGMVDSVVIHDCLNVLINLDNFNNVSHIISKSRVRANLIVTGEAPDEVLQKAETMLFDVYIEQTVDEKNGKEVFDHYSPFDASGKSVNRKVRLGHFFSNFPVQSETEALAINGGIYFRILEKRIDITPLFKSSSMILARLAAGDVDMAIQLPSFDWNRYNMGFEFSPGLGQRGIGFIKSHPKPKSSTTTLTSPFNGEVWLLLMLTTLLVWFCLSVARRLSISTISVAFESFGLTVGMLIKESLPPSWYEQPGVKAMNVSLFLWMLSQTLLSEAYKSNLLSHLIKADYKKQPESLQDLVDMQSEIHIRENQLATNILRTSPLPLHQRIYREGVLERGGFIERGPWPPPHLKDAYDNTNKIIGMSYSDVMDYYEHNAQMIPEYVYSSPTGYFYRLKFPMKNEIDLACLVMEEAGIFIKQKAFRTEVVLRGVPHRNPPDDSQEAVSLALEHLNPSFLQLMIFLAISVIAFLTEKFSGKPKRFRRLQRSQTL